MKKFFFLTSLLFATSFSILNAQTTSDEAEIKAFTEAFVTAYNEQDLDAIKNSYLADAVRIDPNGQEFNGVDQIVAYFQDQFINNKTTLTVQHKQINWSDYQYAFVASGTYEVKGNTIVYDIPIHDAGTYQNTMIKEKNGEWKIAKSVLTADD